VKGTRELVLAQADRIPRSQRRCGSAVRDSRIEAVAVRRVLKGEGDMNRRQRAETIQIVLREVCAALGFSLGCG
jgi:hypothetical protein